jgi:hypothetical protein
MLLLALALASQSIPKAHYVPACDEIDHPEVCARQERRDERRAFKVCGPDGMVDWDAYPGKPDCNRDGWDGRRYRRTSK